MADEWFYKSPQAKEPTGPVSLTELREMERAGALAPATLIREGEGAWHTLRSMVKQWDRNGSSAHRIPAAAIESAESGVVPLGDDSLDPSIIDDIKLTHAGESEPTEITDLDDLDITLVDESSSMDGIDDLMIVSESEAPPVRTSRQRSRVLDSGGGSDAAAFDEQFVVKSRGDVDAEEEIRELRALAEQALSVAAKPKKLEVPTASVEPGEDSGAATAPESAPAAGDGAGWMLRVEGDEHGPVDFNTLREWVDEGRILEEDELQLPGSDVWIPAGSMPVLFAGIVEETPSAPAAPSPGPAPASDPIVSAPEFDDSPATPPPTSSSPSPAATGSGMGMDSTPTPASGMSMGGGSSSFGATGGMSGGGMSGGGPAFATSRPAAGKTKSKRGKIDRGPSRMGESIRGLFSGMSVGAEIKPWHIGILVVCSLILGWMFFPGFDNDQSSYDMLMGHYQQYQTLRTSGAGDAEWNAFWAAAEPEVTKLAEELAKTASAKEPEKQRMLWAARDAFPKFMKNKAEDTESEQQFTKYMSEAKMFLDGTTPVAAEQSGGENTEAVPDEPEA